VPRQRNVKQSGTRPGTEISIRPGNAHHASSFHPPTSGPESFRPARYRPAWRPRRHMLRLLFQFVAAPSRDTRLPLHAGPEMARATRDARVGTLSGAEAQNVKAPGAAFLVSFIDMAELIEGGDRAGATKRLESQALSAPSARTAHSRASRKPVHPLGAPPVGSRAAVASLRRDTMDRRGSPRHPAQATVSRTARAPASCA
jgi:hypothetical protein